MAELFDVQRPAITKHLKNIFATEELNEDSVSSIMEHTADDGKNYKTKFYNLDAIIAVGYRVNSKQATQFRMWATQVLREYIIKGFAMKDWTMNLDAFLQFNEQEILSDAGKISHEVALALAEKEYKAFQKIQDATHLSDFDREVKRLTKRHDSSSSS